MTNRDGFKNASGGKLGGCFTCEDCGKLTRDTGNDEASAQLCLRCLNSNFLENLSSDGIWTAAQRQEMLAVITAARSGEITSKKMASELKRFQEIADSETEGGAK